MKSRIVKYFSLMALMVSLLTACGPKEIDSEPALFSEDSKSWIPFEGNETVKFVCVDDTMVFEAGSKTSFFERKRYMSDQSGFFTVQEDYYADLEREELTFESPSSRYFMRYYLEKSKGETGEWDMIHITLGDGDYYKNEIRMVVYETDNFPKAETFQHKSVIKLNGVNYSNIYYLKQERRPFELYYSKTLGVIGFKLSANELYTILH